MSDQASAARQTSQPHNPMDWRAQDISVPAAVGRFADMNAPHMTTTTADVNQLPLGTQIYDNLADRTQFSRLGAQVRPSNYELETINEPRRIIENQTTTYYSDQQQQQQQSSVVVEGGASSQQPQLDQQRSGGGGNYATTTTSQSHQTYEASGMTVNAGREVSGMTDPGDLEDRVIRREETVGESRVVGVEKGEPRVISERVREASGERVIISERFVEHAVPVSKKIVREEVYETTKVVPEKTVVEEVEEEVKIIREKVIELAVPIIEEQVIEIPEIEYVEKVIEVPEIVIQEKTIEVPITEIIEQKIRRPRTVYQDRIVKVPKIVYNEIPKIVYKDIPQIVEIIKEIKKPVPRYVDVPTPQYVEVEKSVDVKRAMPVPVEAITTCKFKLPKIRPKYVKVEVPICLPRYVEVPVPAECFAQDSQALMQFQRYNNQLGALAQQSKISLCEIESFAHEVSKFMTTETTTTTSTTTTSSVTNAVSEAWQSGRINVDPTSLTYTHYETAVPLII